MTSKIFFSDVDNTLIHKNAKGIKIPEEDRFISKESIELIERIRKKIPVVLITGRRITGYDRLKVIPHDFGIIEHGCIVLKRHKIDKKYAKEFIEYIGYPWKKKNFGYLWDYELELQKKGFVTDSKDRYGSFRIDPAQNPNKIHEINQFLKMEHPHGIKAVRNLSFLDFIPPMGGKGHAINYILHRKSLRWENVFAFGDDYNDLDMLVSAGHPCTLDNAVPEVKHLVMKKKGFISKKGSNYGTEDVLRFILFNVS